MANTKAISLTDLLGKSITLVEDVFGVPYERSGRVIGVITALPGSRCTAEFLLDQDDGDCCYYAPDEIRITRIR